METLLYLINEIANNDEMETVINAIKLRQKELKDRATFEALQTLKVGDKVLCDSRQGVEEATILKINRTTADIEIGKDKYTAPLSILKPMEVA